jgi:hypothetical protein
LPTFTCAHIMVIQVTTFWIGILLNILQAFSMVPYFAYMSTKLLPTKTFESHPIRMIYSWTCMPSSTTSILAHAFNTPTKVRKFGYTFSYYICQNSFNKFSPFPHFMCPNIMAL